TRHCRCEVHHKRRVEFSQGGGSGTARRGGVEQARAGEDHGETDGGPHRPARGGGVATRPEGHRARQNDHEGRRYVRAQGRAGGRVAFAKRQGNDPARGERTGDGETRRGAEEDAGVVVEVISPSRAPCTSSAPALTIPTHPPPWVTPLCAPGS